MPAELRFPVMGSSAHLLVVGGRAGLVAQGRRRLHDLERRWSRFLPDSEVSRLNAAAGTPLAVSDETRLLVRRSLEGHAVTGGAFDPTVLGAVVRAGYDRTFSGLEPGSAPWSPLHGGAADVEIDVRRGTVLLPPGVGFDPGGIGKGLAADLVAEELVAEGAVGVCVNVGGDARVTGRAPDGGAWRVEVEADDGRPPTVLALTEGGVATSSPLRRRWNGPDGEVRHHLVDPGTGRSAATTVTSATVVAATAWRAEVLTKPLILRGVGSGGLELVERLGADARLVEGGRVTATTHWAAFTLTPASAGSRP